MRARLLPFGCVLYGGLLTQLQTGGEGMTSRGSTALILLAIVGLVLSAGPVQAAPALSLALAVQPGTVQTGGEVVYTVTVTNTGEQSISGLAISDTLPPGFAYRTGSTIVTLNGTRLRVPEPALSGRTLTWTDLQLPSARSSGNYGMHTFFQDNCNNSYIDFQLDRVREMGGPGAYVKQLLYYITAETPGPQACWVHFVNAAYDRGLIPVVRLQGVHGGSYWVKPQPDPSGGYATIAQAYKRVVAGLPRRDNQPLYVEVWNEPNLSGEWGGKPEPTEYARFLVDVSAALRSLNDARIVILNGALSPGGDYNNLAFIDAMAAVPGALQAFDVWATHPYPGNHPPEYNNHDGSALYRDMTIDSYLLELDRLAAHGRTGLRVLLTETGYAFGAYDFGFEGFPQMSEDRRADYMKRAWRDYWSRWPEVLGVCPYELVDPQGNWWVWDWLYANGGHRAQFDAVASLDKRPTLAPSTLKISFRASVSAPAGIYTSDLSASAGGMVLATANAVAPVTVVGVTPVATATSTQPWPTHTPTRTGTPPTPTATPTLAPNCQQVLRNGGFEDDGDWVPMGGAPAGYSVTQVRSGARSLRLGLEGAENRYAYSSAEQELRLPVGPGVATLSLWYKVVSGDSSGDRAYVLLRGNDQAYRMLGSLDLRAQGWTCASFDTSGYLGQDVAVRLSAVNDGAGSTTAVYVDDVQWLFCSGDQSPATPTPTATPRPTLVPTPSATPTPTPTVTPLLTPCPTPTMPPKGCVEGIRDGGFETGDGWSILETSYRAGYVTGPVRSGSRALRLGIAEGPDVASYSSAEQAVMIPSDASAARLSFWMYRVSADQSGDLQYLLILDEGGGYESALWELRHAPSWERREVSLDAYRGQRVVLRFGVRNDGDGARTAMYIDDVAVALCVGATPTPEPTAVPTSTPTAIVWSRTGYLPMIIKGAGYLSEVAGRQEEQPSSPQASADLKGSLATPEPSEEGGGSRERPYPSGARDWRAVAVDPESGIAYVVADDGIWALDTDGQDPARCILAGAGYHAAFVDLRERRLVVSDWGNGAVVALDLDNGAVVARASPLLRPSGIAVHGDRLFVTETAADRVVILDRHTCGIIGVEPVGPAPYAVAADARHGRVWVANAGGSTVTVLDARIGRPTGAVSLDGLGHPQGVAIDSARSRVYVTYLLTPRYHSLAVINAESLRVEQVLRGSPALPLVGAYGVAVEPGTGRIFLSDVAGLVAVDPQTLAVHVEQPGGGFLLPFGLVMEQASRRLLMVDAGGLRALPAR